MKVRTTKADGFTLLELLVAIALLAVVVVVIVQAMRLGMRAIESGDRKIAGLERTRALLSVI
ncbi:MAG TPA: prepilin-type N-terminal cleavage/methylation domain-containing protein, partial [Dissulfurispiraceae bacterium]|nr:prepilin-type N-terminal cleavage/methylation domain-containing protein [Dissulfurispiraceae bacterium]